ncbi:MAG: cupin domain-containing protein [Clostridia bacterium]|nr:cupin domain-containing protein [Clostridia bacterium]
MPKIQKNQRWIAHADAEAVAAAPGVTRRVLAYTDALMCVENHFQTGAVGSLHSHPHTQITYVASGVFRFTIEGEERTVHKGDAMLKLDGVEHGCVCVEEGVLLDIFNPMRVDFV